MDVVEDDDQRLLPRERFEELAEPPGDLLGRGGDPGGSERGGDARSGELRIVVVSQRRAGIAQLGDDLGQGPVGDPVAVGKTAADEDARL